MLCTFCRASIFESNRPWGFHRPSYSSPADKSEIDGCDFCVQLCADASSSLLQQVHRTGGPFRSLAASDSAPTISPSYSDLWTMTGHFEAAYLTCTNQKAYVWLNTSLGEPIRKGLGTRFRGGQRRPPLVSRRKDMGTERMFTLTTENKGQLMKVGIDDSDLQSNFRDVIEVTRRLGIRYIWIDSLCIIQDNKEFAIEGLYMHDVYRNSFCTIAAAASDGPSGGLFRAGPERKFSPGVVKGHGGLSILRSRSSYILPNNIWTSQLLTSILYTRGWVFQVMFCAFLFDKDLARLLTADIRAHAVASHPALFRPPNILGLFHGQFMRYPP
ncbi:heterokaryon incompatibility protein-domain-containing protein [Podospora didyma]|uniref:Heterokaryon incompatibility protein-domain-containing protein n=1 Tax=Podospora didyma TaxID=330526 RepID=A0AAE0N588_9PEZI|nr:heterokaryon incompatibility protein-domain-containing protein [Podospora didyma]